MTPAEQIATIETFLAHVNKGEFEAASQFIHPDFFLIEQPGLPYAGEYRGRDGFLDLMKAAGGTWERWRDSPYPYELAADGSRVIKEVHFTATASATAQEVAMDFAEVFVFEDDLIARTRASTGTPRVSARRQRPQPGTADPFSEPSGRRPFLPSDGLDQSAAPTTDSSEGSNHPMIKMITLLKRNPGLTREEFEEHWRNVHAELVRDLPDVSIHMRRYVQNYMIGGGRQASEEFGGVGLPSDDFDFDGIMEAQFDSMEDMARMTSTQAYLEFIHPDEQHLVDAAGCKVYLTEEYVVVDAGERPPAEAQSVQRAPLAGQQSPGGSNQ